MKTTMDAIRDFAQWKPETKVCEYCYHILQLADDEQGVYYYCPNQMCLSEENYYIELPVT